MDYKSFKYFITIKNLLKVKFIKQNFYQNSILLFSIHSIEKI